MRRRWICLPAALLLAALFAPAYADVEISKMSEVVDSFTLGIDLNTFYRVDSQPYFGLRAGEFNPGLPTNADTGATNTNFGEVFANVRLTAGKDVGWTDLMAQVGFFYAQTVDQDVYTLFKDEHQIGVNQAWIEFAQLFDRKIGVRVGRQDIRIEKWFLVADGGTQEAAGWLPYVASFPMAVVVNAEFEPLTVTAFWARPEFNTGDPFGFFTSTGRENDDVDLMGINLHWALAENAYLYGGYYRTFDESENVFAAGGPPYAGDDLNVFDIGGELTLMDALTLEGEFAYQTGDDDFRNLDNRAYAWFGSAAYQFGGRYAPYLRGMYVFYSGDEDPNDGDMEAWNPFFTDFVGWNRWVQGEQTAEVWLVQTNKEVAIAEVGFTPIEPMTVSLHYLKHWIEEKGSFGTTSDNWGDEVNLFVDYTVNDHLFAHFGTGFVIPDDAAEEVAGNDKTAYFAQLWLAFYL
ncbi:MAG: hypothetical protein Kow0092_18170 [Deferrisomatales bacterium]